MQPVPATPTTSPTSTPCSSVTSKVASTATKSGLAYALVLRKMPKSTNDSTATTMVAASVACGREHSAGVRNSGASKMPTAVNAAPRLLAPSATSSWSGSMRWRRLAATVPVFGDRVGHAVGQVKAHEQRLGAAAHPELKSHREHAHVQREPVRLVRLRAQRQAELHEVVSFGLDAHQQHMAPESNASVVATAQLAGVPATAC